MRFAMIMFCLSLEHAFKQIPQQLSQHIVRSGYQDDQYLVGNMVELADLWDPLVEALHLSGHKINLSKSEIYMPCLDSISTRDLPDSLRSFASKLRRSVGGVRALGSAAQGQFESILGPYQLSAAPAQARLHRAVEYARRLKEFVVEANDDHCLHTAWLHASKSLSNALSYDARLMPPEAFSCWLAPP